MLKPERPIYGFLFQEDSFSDPCGVNRIGTFPLLKNIAESAFSKANLYGIYLRVIMGWAW